MNRKNCTEMVCPTGLAEVCATEGGPDAESQQPSEKHEAKPSVFHEVLA